MKKGSKRFLLILFFFLSTTYVPLNKKTQSTVFTIKNILIENNKVIEKEEILKELAFLYKKDLMFIDDLKIKKAFQNIPFILGAKIKKIYPDTLKIIIEEKKPIAIMIIEKKKFYITQKGNLIDFDNNKKFSDLPLVFGGSKNFSVLLDTLKKTNFYIKDIKNFYFFEIGRWDIEFKDGKILKLPTENFEQSLINFNEIYDNRKFKDYKIFDYRIDNQLILK